MDSKFKILLVDDNKEILDVLGSDLEDAGYDPVLLDKPLEIEEVLLENLDDLCLIISDYKMPDLSGLELRKKIIPIAKEVPFIILSGFVTKEILAQALELKIDNIIQKPSNINELLENVEKYSKNRKEQLEEKRFLKKIFIEESSELVEELEPLILELEHDPNSTSLINSIFRLVHTIKGGSGVIDWEEFTQFLHKFEDLLGKIKNKKVVPDEKSVSVLLKGFDRLTSLVKDLSLHNKTKIDIKKWETLFSLKDAPPVRNSTEEKESTNPASDKANLSSENIKVPCRILDEFMELSGEITVIKNTVNRLVSSIKKELKGNHDLILLAEMIEEMNKINSSMQVKITDIRKIPINNIFRSFPRPVRDIAKSTNKKIELKVHGETLRIDTSIHQVLSNSLIHVIRNCADHGIESIEERQESGKIEDGEISIDAYESGEFIYIEISDNGRGISAEKIKASAVEKNLYEPKDFEKMSLQNILGIIFQSGFSTAQKITDISGRGVGMDMVKTSVESIGGKIIIDSQVGIGSKFIFKLPIPRSVLIIKSLSVEISEKTYFIPQDNILRIIKIDSKNRNNFLRESSGVLTISIDNNLLPLIQIEKILNEKNSKLNEEYNIVIVKDEEFKYGIKVDRIVDSEEIVVKPLAPYLKKIGSFSGATFMGDGRVGIVLDICGIGKLAKLENKDQLSLKDDSINTTENLKRKQGYLIVKLFSKGVFGIELKHVFRLEQFLNTDIKKVSDQYSIIYRGVVSNIIDLTKKINLNSESKIGTLDKLNTFIVKKEDRYYSFLIEKIEEIVEIDDQNLEPVIDRKQIIGNKIINNKLVNIIDIDDIVKSQIKKSNVSSINENNPNKNETVENKNTVNEAEKAVGWALF